jgi:3,4-dihydroxy 2-butanone 4-phosphate synthase/GTP cyclohydrolase II
MKEDGTMARRDDLDIFAQKHNLKQIFISDLVEYRMANELLITQTSNEKSFFFNSDVEKAIYKDHLDNSHTVIKFGEIEETSLVKFHTIEPDINLFLNENKLNSLLKSINFLQSKGGVLIFLENKNENSETMKDFGIGAQILHSLGIKHIKLLTSGGKHSFVGINGFGLSIKEEIQIN